MENKTEIVLTFTPQEIQKIQKAGTSIPNFWCEPGATPQAHDLVRFGGMQYVVLARIWEHNGNSPVLRLYMGDGKPQSDNTFH